MSKAPIERRRSARDFVGTYDDQAPVEYERRAVAFFDILGWGDAVMSSETDPKMRKKLLNAVWSFAARSQDYIEQETDDLPSQDEYTQFSDSLIVSFPYSIPFDLLRLLKYVAEFQSSMLLMELPLRGGITVGSLYHNEAIVFGPALNRAYHLESKVAKSPRVIVDRELDAVVEKAFRPRPPIQPIVTKSTDGYFETAFLAGFARTVMPRQHVDGLIAGWLTKHAENPDVLPKYQGLQTSWAAAKKAADAQ